MSRYESALAASYSIAVSGVLSWTEDYYVLKILSSPATQNTAEEISTRRDPASTKRALQHISSWGRAWFLVSFFEFANGFDVTLSRWCIRSCIQTTIQSCDPIFLLLLRSSLQNCRCEQVIISIYHEILRFNSSLVSDNAKPFLFHSDSSGSAVAEKLGMTLHDTSLNYLILFRAIVLIQGPSHSPYGTSWPMAFSFFVHSSWSIHNLSCLHHQMPHCFRLGWARES